MNRDKHIEEMTRIGCVGFHESDCENCHRQGFCSSYTVSRKLYNAGYRKSTDVAREIFADIDKLHIHITNPFDARRYAELRNKYESEEADGEK